MARGRKGTGKAAALTTDATPADTTEAAGAKVLVVIAPELVDGVRQYAAHLSTVVPGVKFSLQQAANALVARGLELAALAAGSPATAPAPRKAKASPPVVPLLDAGGADVS